MKQSLYKD